MYRFGRSQNKIPIMPRLLFILAALPIALANFHPARREHSDCFSDQIFCSSTDFGVYAQVIETDDWFANATTIHDLSGLVKSGSLAAKSTGKFEPLCCPIPYSICGLLLPGEVPACYYVRASQIFVLARNISLTTTMRIGRW